MIIEGILNIAKSIVGLRGDLIKARQDRKQLVADFLGAIAQTVELTSADLKQGIFPHGLCQEMKSHSENIEAAVGDLIGQSQAAELAARLKGLRS